MILLLTMLNSLGIAIVAVLIMKLGKKILLALDTLGKFSIRLEESVRKAQEPTPEPEPEPEKVKPLVGGEFEANLIEILEADSQETTPEPEGAPHALLPSEIEDLRFIRDRVIGTAIRLDLLIESLTGIKEPELGSEPKDDPQGQDYTPEPEYITYADEPGFCNLKHIICPYLTEEGTCQVQCDTFMQQIDSDSLEPTPEPEGAPQGQEPTPEPDTKKPQRRSKKDPKKPSSKKK